MSSVPVSMKRIPSRTTEKKGQHRFSNYTLSVAMETSGRIWPNFELIQASMHVLIACKYEKDQMKNISLWDFFIHSRAANSAVLSPIWPNFELVRDVMDVLVTCKYGEDLIKNEGARVDTTFSPL